MKLNKVLFVVAIVAALGIGTMLGPIVGMAQSNFQPPFNQMRAGNSDWQPMGARMGQYFGGTMRESLADELGITVDELYSLRTSGKSIEDIAEEKGVTTDELLQVLTDARTEQLDQLVKDGVISEDQRDFMLERMETNLGSNFSNTECGPANGFSGRGRGMGGFGGGPRWSR